MDRKISYLKWRDKLSEITPDEFRIGTDLLMVKHDSPDPYPPNAPFKCDMTVALFFETGWARMKINMREFKAEAPCVLIIIRDEIYEPLERSDSIRVKAIVMSRRFIDSIISDLSQIHPLYAMLYKEPVIRTDGIGNVFSQYYELLANIVRSQYIEPEFKVKAAGYLTLSMFYGYTCAKHGIETVSKRTRQEDIYLKFIDLLYAHHKKERSLSFYADRLCITPKYLSQIVKEMTGHTAMDYIEDYVVTEAKAMLNSTDLSIQQISDDLNFPSQSVFGKYFKRATGSSPKEYRNKSLGLVDK